MVKNINEIPIWHKLNLTVQEASVYSGIGEKKIRELIKDPMCTFAISVGSGKKLIKRKEFEEWNEMASYI